LERNFCLLHGLKCQLGDVDKATFRRFVWPCEFILCLIVGTKSEVEKAIIQALPGHTISICYLLGGTTCVLVEEKKAMFQGIVWLYNQIFYPVAGTKCDLEEVEKAMF
jgi:hypothetical protein